jgi:hypothetical protein
MTRKSHLHLHWCALMALAFPLDALAQARLGPEFQVNTYTTAAQQRVSVASEEDGDFVVAWESAGDQDGSGSGIFAPRFSSAGAGLGSEFQVNTFTSLNQFAPAVASDADGDFVIAWRSRQDTSDYGVFAHRFSSTGDPLAIEFQVNTYTPFGQRFPRVAADEDGDFVVVWHTFPNQDGSGYGVSAQRFSSSGSFSGIEFQVNTYTPGYQRYPSVGVRANGDFVVAWQSKEQDGSGYGVFAQLFSSGGSPLTGEFQVNTYTANNQRYAWVAADPGGAFVVAWDSDGGQDGSDFGVFARRLSSTGAAVATEFQVNSFTPTSQFFPTVSTDGDSDVVITWSSGSGQDGSSNGIFARRFSSEGSPLATEFQVNSYTPDIQRSSSVAVSGDGDFVVAWWSFAQDGSYYGVFAQRFSETFELDVDGNGSLDALTDGLLVLRSLFGFAGTALTNGAVGNGCTRCNAAAIQPYIAGLGMDLDIDGSTSLDALTDGLLVLRFLFGFTGLALTTNAVNLDDCLRCDASMIVPHLTSLTM